MKRWLGMAIAAFMAAASPANAATTVYGASVFSVTGTVISPTSALGPADGIQSAILRPSTLVLQLTQAASGANVVINGQRATAGTVVQVAVGEIIGGVATFTANLAITGFATSHNLDFTTLCSALSSTGCSLLRVRVSGPIGSAFSLDGVSGVAAAPELSAWSLMLLGFGFVAMRLKHSRQLPAVV